MSLSLTALLIVLAGAIAATGVGGRIHPLVFLLAAGVVFGPAAELSLPYTLRSMDDGFSAAVGSLGPVLIAGSVAGMAIERSQWRGWLTAKLTGSRGRRWRCWMSILGFVGGLGTVREFAFILLMPLAAAVARRRMRPAADTALPLVLAIIVTSALLVPAPGPVAAAAILSADLWQTALWGLAVATTAGVAGGIFSFLAARLLPNTGCEPAAVEEPPAAAPIRPAAALAGVLPVLLPLILLVISSIGHMPNEPLGSGPTRERLLSLGQPIALLLTVLVASAVTAACLRPRIALLSETWTAQALVRVASIAMLVGAAGAFSRVLQNSGLDSMVAEALTDAPLGILLPFAVAAAMKLAQGSSLLAIISTAGLLQPSLPQLGLDDPSGRALCAVAVGAGSMVASHVNDTLFWTFTRLCDLTPAQGLRLLTLGTLVQGVAAAVTLLVISAVVR